MTIYNSFPNPPHPIDPSNLTIDKNNDLFKLIKILEEVGSENIWRPVYAPGNTLLANGIGAWSDAPPEDLQEFDFKGKRVVDLGCNFGYYSFIVKKAGATHVTGIDKESQVVQGCKMLKNLFSVEGVSFLTADITELKTIGTFDIGMMIDFIGKTMISSGRFKTYLNMLEKLSEHNMILSLRPVYNIKKHLNNDHQELVDKYSSDYVRHNCFYTVDFVRDYFEPRWNIVEVSQRAKLKDSDKHLFYFNRK